MLFETSKNNALLEFDNSIDNYSYSTFIDTAKSQMINEDLNKMYKKINMGVNYKIASKIVQLFNSGDYEENFNKYFSININFIELVDNLLMNTEAIISPQKYTLLHSFIEWYIHAYLLFKRTMTLEAADDVRDAEDVSFILEDLYTFERFLLEYGENIPEYKMSLYAIVDTDSEEFDFKQAIYPIIDSMLEKVENIEENLVEDTFHLLYSNKDFLFDFNMFVSKYINPQKVPKEFYENNMIKRCQYLPKWLQRAVIYRDRGKCQHCGRDLSNLISIIEDREIHMDHIIPLESNGTNDATNFQLLCSDCNLKKSGKPIKPLYRYEAFW